MALDFLKKVPIVGGPAHALINGPEKTNTEDLDRLAGRTENNANIISNEYAAVHDKTGPTVVAPGNVTGAQVAGPDKRLDGRTDTALNSLTAAANGTTPSAAQIQLEAQAARNKAASLGLAQAIGGRSPMGALRTAQNAQVQSDIDTNSAAAALRANGQSAARNSLMGALTGLRQEDLSRATTNAGLTQQANLSNQQVGLQTGLANQAGQLDTNRMTLQEKLGLLDAQLRAEGLHNQAVMGKYGGDAANTAATNAYNGQILGTAGQLGVAKLLSDEREKVDIEPADMQKLADSIRPVNFRYRDEKNGSGARTGVLAQDVEKGGNAGKAIAQNRSDGRKVLDIGNAIGAALALAADAHRIARKAS